MYADIDQSLFNQQLHQRNIIVPPLDDSPIEYAKIKHTGKPSVSQKIQSTVKEEFINGPGISGVGRGAHGFMSTQCTHAVV